MSAKDVILVYTSSWTAMYLGGELVLEDSAVDAYDAMVLLQGESVRHVVQRSLSEDGEEYITDRGGFPNRYEDIPQEMYDR